MSRGEDTEPPAPSLTRGELQRRALQGSLWTLVNVTVTLPLSIAANAAAARILGPEEYGELAFLLTALTVAIPLSELGFSQALAQWGVGAEMRRDSATRNLLLRSRAGFVLTVQLPLLWIGGLLVLGGEQTLVKVAFLSATLLLVAGAGAQAALLIENRTALLARIGMAVGIAIQFAIVLTAVTTKDAGTVWSLRLVVSSAAPVLAALFIGGHRFRVTIHPRWPRGLPAGFWRFALLSWIAGASALLVYSRSEVFVLRLYDQATELGLFAVAFGLSQQLTLPVDSLLAPLFPANAGLTTAHPEHLSRGFLRSLRYFALLAGGLLSLVPAVYFATPVMFGDRFGAAANLFLPLGLVSTLQSATSPFTLLAFARRRGRLLASAFILALVVDVGVALALVGPYGAWGAVVANIVGQLIAIAILAKSELAAQGLALRDTVLALRAWLLAWVALVASFAVGDVAAAVGGRLLAVAVAVVAGPVTFALALKVAGGTLTVVDAEALVSPFPARLHRVLRVLLGPATVDDGGTFVPAPEPPDEDRHRQ